MNIPAQQDMTLFNRQYLERLKSSGILYQCNGQDDFSSLNPLEKEYGNCTCGLILPLGRTCIRCEHKSRRWRQNDTMSDRSHVYLNALFVANFIQLMLFETYTCNDATDISNGPLQWFTQPNTPEKVGSFYPVESVDMNNLEDFDWTSSNRNGFAVETTNRYKVIDLLRRSEYYKLYEYHPYTDHQHVVIEFNRMCTIFLASTIKFYYNTGLACIPEGDYNFFHENFPLHYDPNENNDIRSPWNDHCLSLLFQEGIFSV
jgi:hypothetical protein